jgi:hypothetical protein
MLARIKIEVRSRPRITIPNNIKKLYRKNWLTIVNGHAVACYQTGTTAVSLQEAGEYCGDNIGLNTCLGTGEKSHGI